MYYRTHSCGELRKINVDEEVILNGWVDIIRDLGGIKFILLRDRFGKTQLRIDPEHNKDLYEKALLLNNEYTICIKGIVKERPNNAINENMLTGEIEILVNYIDILSESETPPIYVNKDEDISEELRLRYRYLDLRKERLQKNLLIKNIIMKTTRDYLANNSFLEIETPYLTKSTPEGARDFVVPSRLKKGKFYALPQSPQIFKQILMVSGFDRYFQIARCFRDEDFRADRQPEFTQIDLEASFVDKEFIYKLSEGLLKNIFKETINYNITTPLKRLKYKEALDKYGIDKPDTRYGMELINVTNYFDNTEAQFIKNIINNEGLIKGFVIENIADQFSRKDFDNLTKKAKDLGANGLIWISIKNNEIKSSIKNLAEKEINQLIENNVISDNDVMLLLAGENDIINKILGLLRLKIIKDSNIKPNIPFELLWITDFPMFSYNEEENRLEAEHHPFTMPVLEDLEKHAKEPLKINSQSYDLVINGYEMASGSERIHRKDIQNKVFELIGINKDDIELKFGFLLKSFSFGAPPHAGIAFGLDRLTAVICGEDSIRDVIAFPKTTTGTCLMSEAPSELAINQLNDLNLKIINNFKEGD